MAETGQSCPRDVVIRALGPADAGVLREIAALVIVAWGGQPSAEEVERRVVRLAADLGTLDPERAAIFAAWRGGEIVGFGRVRRDEADSCVWQLFAAVVHPSHRRQGIASALARARIEYARERGARCILSEVHADNAVSIEYHRSLGFINEGTVTAADGDRLVRFRMELV